jgi:hypothetical protein
MSVRASLALDSQSLVPVGHGGPTQLSFITGGTVIASEVLGGLFDRSRGAGAADYLEIRSEALRQESGLLVDEFATQMQIVNSIDAAITMSLRDDDVDCVSLVADRIRVAAMAGLNLDRLIDSAVAGLNPAGQTLLVTAVGEAGSADPTINASPLLVRCLTRSDSAACRVGAVQAIERLGSPEFVFFLQQAADGEPLEYVAALKHDVAEALGGD